MRRGAATLICSALVAAATLVLATPSTATAAVPELVRIMPIGDSITHGNQDDPSYRYWLWDLLQAEECDVDLVGRQYGVDRGAGQTVDDNDYDQAHEGYGGKRADELAALTPGAASLHRPDIAVIHLGTNDVLQGQSPQSTEADLRAVIEGLRAVDPTVAVVLAQIIPARNNVAAVAAVNQRIAAIASDLTSSQSPVVLVDQHTGFDPVTMTYDGLHPNDVGAAQIAQRFQDGLRPLLGDACGTPGPTSSALFVMGAPTLTGNDAATKVRLEQLGFEVTTVRDRDAGSASLSGVDLVVVSSSTNSARVGGAFNQTTVPVLAWEAYLYDDLGLTGPTALTDYGDLVDDRVQVTAGHPLAAGLSGTVVVTTSDTNLAFGRPTAGATTVATHANGRGALFVLAPGDTRANNTPAPGCRIAFPAFDTSPARHTPAGWALFDAAVDHTTTDCSDGTTPPPVNAAPSVNAGADRTVTALNTTLSGTVTDDGLPTNTLTTTWAQTGGPSGATIANASATTTGVTFPANGTYQFRLTASDGQLSSNDTVSITVNASSPTSSSALFVHGTNSLSVDDTASKARLEQSGFEVTTVRDRDAGSASLSGADLVVISSSTNSAKVGGAFNQTTVPVLVWDPYLYDDLGLTGPTALTDYGDLVDDRVQVTGGHPLAAGLSGTVVVTTSDTNLAFGRPTAGATTVATHTNGTGALFVLAPGDTRANNTAAPGCRIAFPAFDTSPSKHTPAGWALFDAAVDHTTTNCQS